MVDSLGTEQDALAYLRSTRAIRERTGQLLRLAQADQLEHFRLDSSKLGRAVQLTLDEIRLNYPNLLVPFHSRWRHFEGAHSVRLERFSAAFQNRSVEATGIAAFDLAIVSVLLDAGAGTGWKYRDAQGYEYSRSEGLAMASFDACARGDFSLDGRTAFVVDAAKLSNLAESALAEAFQVSPSNPLIGIAGRCALLRSLGKVALSNTTYFSTTRPRPGDLFTYLQGIATSNKLEAERVLSTLLEAFSNIWPGRITLGNSNLGDTWRHSRVSGEAASQGLVPFHKLSQWLTYSLIEPLQQSGVELLNIDSLTGLAEYRNGGLFVDSGVILPRDTQAREQRFSVDSEFVIEWRALTVGLLDQLAEELRSILKLSSEKLPLPAILQGGTWSAGRKCAASLRPDGRPPFLIESDGTVF